MRVAVLRFPGSNCDQDAVWALRRDLGVEADYLWHEESSLSGFDGVFVPGGFSYGDYLRCGAIAARSEAMKAVVKFAADGGPVIGVCNGFQTLCEAGLLPGALLLNAGERFLCRDVFLKAESRSTPWTNGIHRVIRLPIAHGEGRYVCDPDTLERVVGEGQVAFRYCSASGETGAAWNPNGSVDSIAGLVNARGNVLGMMPHPERSTNGILGGTDGKLILGAFLNVLAS